MITVATWNVLHRIHADNWGEDAIKSWPDETKRIAAITATVAERTENVIALQEVSGDQLASLRLAFPDREIHTLRYERVPRPHEGSTVLSEPEEYLVLITDESAQEVIAESFQDDSGKGALAVMTAGIVVIATHLSGDRRRVRQLGRLVELTITAPSSAAVLLGDFNTDRATVVSSLGSDFDVADLPAFALPTRPGTSIAASHSIDHVVVRGAVASDAAVADSYGLSDHNLVRATIAANL